jgi:hypothetical protein
VTDPNPTTYSELVTEAHDALGRRNNGGELPADIIALAQVRATLAAAEQARISNLIAIARYNTDEMNLGRKYGLTPTVDQMTRLHDLQGAIRDALGLPAPEAEQSGPPLRNPPAPEPEEDFDDGLTEAERVTIERLPIGVAQALTGHHLAYRIWWLGDIAKDGAEDATTMRLAAEELALYAPEEKAE